LQDDVVSKTTTAVTAAAAVAAAMNVPVGMPRVRVRMQAGPYSIQSNSLATTEVATTTTTIIITTTTKTHTIVTANAMSGGVSR
jgi:hypothetical protein